MSNTQEYKDRIIQEYTLAYENANPGKRATVTHTGHGWYTIATTSSAYQPSTKYRLSKLVEMAERLRSRVA